MINTLSEVIRLDLMKENIMNVAFLIHSVYIELGI